MTIGIQYLYQRYSKYFLGWLLSSQRLTLLWELPPYNTQSEPSVVQSVSHTPSPTMEGWSRWGRAHLTPFEPFRCSFTGTWHFELRYEPALWELSHIIATPREEPCTAGTEVSRSCFLPFSGFGNSVLLWFLWDTTESVPTFPFLCAHASWSWRLLFTTEES